MISTQTLRKGRGPLKYIKSKNDVIFLVGIAVYVCLCTLSLWWLLALPLGLLGVMFYQSMGQPKEEGIVLSTRLVTTGDAILPCRLIIREAEILVVSRSILNRFDTIYVFVSQLEACLVDDRGDTAGFTIEFDHGQLIFFEAGLFCGRRARKAAKLISDMHTNWYKGTDVPTVGVVNVSKSSLIEPNELVHRPNQS